MEDLFGAGPDLVKALVPQEAPWEEGAAGYCGEQPCLLAWNYPASWRPDEGAAIEVADAAQHVAQSGLCHPVNPWTPHR